MLGFIIGLVIGCAIIMIIQIIVNKRNKKKSDNMKRTNIKDKNL